MAYEILKDTTPLLGKSLSSLERELIETVATDDRSFVKKLRNNRIQRREKDRAYALAKKELLRDLFSTLEGINDLTEDVKYIISEIERHSFSTDSIFFDFSASGKSDLKTIKNLASVNSRITVYEPNLKTNEYWKPIWKDYKNSIYLRIAKEVSQKTGIGITEARSGEAGIWVSGESMCIWWDC